MPQVRRSTASPVSAADLEELVRAADSLASLQSLAAVRREAVEIVGRLVDSTMVAWNEVDLQGHQIDAVLSPPLERCTSRSLESLSAAFIEHVWEHPVIAHYQRTGDGRPYAISDFLSPAAFHETGIYRHFYRHLGAEDQLSFVLPDPALVIGVALNRPSRGFRPRDRELCNLLRPHLLQAYRTVEVAGRMNRMAAALEHLAGGAGLGIIRLGGEGCPDRIDAAARGILSRFFATTGSAALPQEISRWLAGGRRCEASELVIDRADGRGLTIYRASTSTGELLLLAERRVTPPDGRRLGLTGRETEVLTLVREGLSTKRIASALGISTRTVDKHIQHALDKLGVRTRIQAISLLARAPAILPELRDEVRHG